MAFVPRFCPKPYCAAHTGQGFTFQRRGSYRRKCDGLVVPCFSCNTCGGHFSRQTFRFNYRWWRPTAHLELFRLFVSKVTLRQAARITGYSRVTVAARVRSMGAHCRRWHRQALAKCPGLSGAFLLDELETFEADRLVKPVTVPVLIQKRSLFVVDLQTAPLPSRGRLGPYHQLRKLRHEELHGKRRSGSRRAVEQCFQELRRVLEPRAALELVTDRKSSYRTLIRRTFGQFPCNHARVSSRARRDRRNPLFPINHTLAMMRDGVSRLVRRSWGAAKLRDRLEEHLWIWAAYRNYVRGITVEAPRVTPAMVAGVSGRQMAPAELFRWRWVGGRPDEERGAD